MLVEGVGAGAEASQQAVTRGEDTGVGVGVVLAQGASLQLLLVEHDEVTVRIHDHVDIQVAPVELVFDENGRAGDVGIPALEVSRCVVEGECVDRLDDREILDQLVACLEADRSGNDCPETPGSPDHDPAGVARLDRAGIPCDDVANRIQLHDEKLAVRTRTHADDWLPATRCTTLSTSSVFFRSSSGVVASTLIRRSGCVLDGRALNHQSGYSTVSPSR
ncbi:hypothetical protein HRbin27_01891 [bacterium HR27]|nr:hypothetical protein HRbin27_01891 [bacterium HR27]